MGWGRPECRYQLGSAGLQGYIERFQVEGLTWVAKDSTGIEEWMIGCIGRLRDIWKV